MGVVITGIGLMTPLAATREANWQRLLQLDQHPLTFDSPEFPSSLPLNPDWCPDHTSIGLLNAMAVRLAREALNDAGWLDSHQVQTLQSPRFGCVIGTSKGPLEAYHRWPAEMASQKDATAVSSLPFASLWPSSPSSYVLAEFGMTGPAVCPVSACATGLDAVLRGVRLIEQGDCDVVLAGSVDSSVNAYVLNSYRRLGVLAQPSRPVSEACRPFDTDRSGFVLGAGGAIFVLARAESPWAQPRQAYARWLSGLSYNDPLGLTQLDPQGQTLTRLLGDLLIRSPISTTQVDVLQLHGTGTHSNDLTEATAVSRVFGSPSQQPWTTATKGAHGHALGAAGSMELAWLLLSLRDGLLPPIWNLHELDPACPIRPVLQQPLAVAARYGVKISLGFGGHQIACLLERGDRPAVSGTSSVGPAIAGQGEPIDVSVRQQPDLREGKI